MPNLEAFMHSNLRAVWIDEDSIRVYVRKGRRAINGMGVPCFDVANIEVDVDKRRQGVFKAWLARAEVLARDHEFTCVLVENVHNEHLLTYLLANGYRTGYHAPDCYYKLL